LDLHTLYFDKADPADLLPLEGELRAEVRHRLVALGHDGSADLDAALADWAGIENLEERVVPGLIDPLVLAHLRGLDVQTPRRIG
jgi:hypothetical protein